DGGSEGARPLHDRAHRDLQGQHPREQPAGPRYHRHPNREAVDRQREARLGRSVPRGGLAVQRRDRARGGQAGVRRDPVRLRPLPHRRQAGRREVCVAQQQGDAASRHRRLPRPGATRARPAGGLRRRRRLRGGRLDALEPPERLHGRRAAAERGLRDEVKLLLVLSLILTAALLFVSFAGAGELAPNELGRVMILEYHKIDYPEERWTRTPENFRRDLETLYAKGYRLINLGDLL